MIGLRILSRYCSHVSRRGSLKVRHVSYKNSTNPVLASSSYQLPIPYENNGLNRSVNSVVRQNRRLIHVSATSYADLQFGVVPPFADSISEGDLLWVKQVGDSVAADETVAEVETDKTTVAINAPCSGVITECFLEDGTTVTPGTKVFSITPGEAGASAPASEAPKTESAAPAAAAAAAGAAAAGAAAVAATAPPAAAAPATPPPAAAAPPPPPPPPGASSHKHVAAIQHSAYLQQTQVKVPPEDYSKTISGTRTEQRVKMSRMRQRIASRLKEAQNTYAMLTTVNEVDLSNLMELRKSVGEQFLKKHGIKLGLMSAFVKASAYALTKIPVVNAVIEGGEIIYRDYVDISVAVATPKGLVVPVIRNAEAMDFLDVERAIAALGEKARHNAIAIEDMDGGTFTISNGGVFGSLLGTPIINPPQSAILGMHGIFDRPVVRNGQVVIRPMMYIALTYDHRLIDGREAVTFLRQVKTAVEDPRTMFCSL